jgi:DNA-binding XRE family transcriptional regulator
MKEFTPAKRHIEVSVGESVRILREFQELSQNELADISGIPQSTISAIENDRISLGLRPDNRRNPLLNRSRRFTPRPAQPADITEPRRGEGNPAAATNLCCIAMGAALAGLRKAGWPCRTVMTSGRRRNLRNSRKYVRFGSRRTLSANCRRPFEREITPFSVALLARFV